MGEIAWKPDSTHLAINDDSVIHIWDLSNPQQPAIELSNPQAKNIRYLDWVDRYIAASYTPNTGNEGFIQIWDSSGSVGVSVAISGGGQWEGG